MERREYCPGDPVACAYERAIAVVGNSNAPTDTVSSAVVGHRLQPSGGDKLPCKPSAARSTPANLVDELDSRSADVALSSPSFAAVASFEQDKGSGVNFAGPGAAPPGHRPDARTRRIHQSLTGTGQMDRIEACRTQLLASR